MIAEAIETGDEESVIRALGEHAELIGEHPGVLENHLDRAVELGRARAVAAMLRGGAFASWPDESGVTPLMTAASHGRLEIARMLLEAGADPDDLAFRDDQIISDPSLDGRCALFFALVGEHPGLVGLIEPLTSPRVRELAEQAARRESERESALSPVVRRLFRAVAHDDADAVAAALAEGADPECSDEQGTTPLAYAATWDKPAALAALLKGGAGVDAPGDLLGRTALILAIRMGVESVLAPLLAAGADTGGTDEEGRTTWQLAARTGLIRAMRRAWREARGTEPPA
jgi:ankyrin repeat protein